MNKKGQIEGSIYTVLLWVILIIFIVGVLLVALTDSSGSVVDTLDALPDGLVSTIEAVTKVATPIVSGIFWVVAPADQPENVQMIAFGIFLLLTLVGTKALRPFIKGPFLAFFISVIIGVIAGRSLTATILEETAFGASPIAAVSLIIGFLPVFALTKNIDKWGLVTQWSKMVVFTVAGVVYVVIFWLAFDSRVLGITYGLGIVLLGAAQLIVPYFKRSVEERKNQSLGMYMANVQETIQTAEEMHEGAERRRQNR